MKIKNLVREVIPPFAWRVGKKVFGKKAVTNALEPWRDCAYQGVKTAHNARPLHVGRFANLVEEYALLDPWHSADVIRYRTYNLCCLATMCRSIPGDFAVAGVSWGVAPRVIYDYVSMGDLDKTFHFVDPFMAIDNATDRKRLDKYNTDAGFVRKQYIATARIQIHQVLIPQGLPLADVNRLAFVHLNTGDCHAEAQSLPYFYELLSPGGWLVIDNYAIGNGHFDFYDPVLQKLDIEPIWLPSGQAALTKLS